MSWLDDLRRSVAGDPAAARSAPPSRSASLRRCRHGAVFQGWLPPRSTGRRRRCSGSGSSICSISWTASTGSPAARRRRSASGWRCSRRRHRAPIRRCAALAAALGARARARLPGLELGAGAHLSRRCRQRAARLSARLSAARHRRARLLEARADPAAVFPRRRDDHAAAPPAARRARVAAASRAFLSAGGAARVSGHAAVVRRVIAADAIADRLRPGSPRPSPAALGLAIAAATVLALLASLAGAGRRAYTAPDPSDGAAGNGGQQ